MLFTIALLFRYHYYSSINIHYQLHSAFHHITRNYCNLDWFGSKGTNQISTVGIRKLVEQWKWLNDKEGQVSFLLSYDCIWTWVELGIGWEDWLESGCGGNKTNPEFIYSRVPYTFTYFSLRVVSAGARDPMPLPYICDWHFFMIYESNQTKRSKFHPMIRLKFSRNSCRYPTKPSPSFLRQTHKAKRANQAKESSRLTKTYKLNQKSWLFCPHRNALYGWITLDSTPQTPHMHHK